MAVLKCKMCGGDLNVTADEKVVECDFCGTQQTVPTSKDENLQGLFNRANILRMKSEFDKAEQLYEKIIQKDETQAEAYWGLILCKYGIEYVEDPDTYKRIPTCHRASYDSVISDEDYKSALEYADGVQRGIYESEAKEIDRIQKEIIELSQKQESYDVFICYKETDSDGKRTQDSVIANDIYHQLTQEGLRVFYAAITLEDKLGSAYEPCIFAALNSAKVMLTIGTKAEYFNAVWVKNEWSRFLKIIKNDRSKLLIPCYRDMDAYELPEEFAHLQAQDMAKIGFINDIVRGIKKVTIKDEPKAAVIKETVVTADTTNGNITALLKRGYLALEDGEWEKADDFFEQVLNHDAELAEAYLGKLMADIEVEAKEDLKDCEEPFDNNSNYKKIVRFGDEKLKNELDGYLSIIEERCNQAEMEEIYAKAKALMSVGTSESHKAAAELFDKVISYKDSKELKEKCFEEIKRIEDIKKKESEAFQKSLQKANIRSSQSSISAGSYHTVGLNSDGTVVAVGDNEEGQCDVSEWADIVALSAGISHTVGLKSNGRVVATNKGDIDLYHGQCDVSEWTDIVAISAGCHYTVGVRPDGTVVAVGENEDGQCDVSEWKDIVAISAGSFHTVGLKSDGTVVAVGGNNCGQCNVSDWTDIMAISAGSSCTVGLKSDGTVIATKYTGDMDYYTGQCDVLDWTDIVAISAGDYHTVGLKSDGTVVAVGDNEEGQCDVSKLRNIAVPVLAETKEELKIKIEKRIKDFKEFYVSKFSKIIEKTQIANLQTSISAGFAHTVALRSNGTVVATKYKGNKKFYAGECEVSDWTDIVTISAGASHTVGLKSDGTVVATKYIGESYSGQCDVSDWTDIIAISAGSYYTVGLKSDGTVVAVGDNHTGQCNVSDWTDIMAISACSGHTVGLKSDGTVVATKYEDNKKFYAGQCDVSSWREIVAISAGDDYTVGLKSDGTVVAVGGNNCGQCNVSDWTDIMAISAGSACTIGLKSDGTVVATKYEGNEYFYSGECEVSDWTDIVTISAGGTHTVGLKSDGTVVATIYTGDYHHRGQSNVSGWDNISVPILAETMEEYKKLAKEKQLQEQKRREFEQLKAQRRSAGVCQYCGGSFKGLIFKTCTSCGKGKDY